MELAIKENGWDLDVKGEKTVTIVHHFSRLEPVSYKCVAVFNRFDGGSKRHAKSFVYFLVENFTPEEFFCLRSAGKEIMEIMTDRGYVKPKPKTNRRAA